MCHINKIWKSSCFFALFLHYKIIPVCDIWHFHSLWCHKTARSTINQSFFFCYTIQVLDLLSKGTGKWKYKNSREYCSLWSQPNTCIIAEIQSVLEYHSSVLSFTMLKDSWYSISVQTAAPKMKLMTGDRKNSCNHHHCWDHHNSMPARVHISFPVEWNPGEVQLDDAGVKSVYTSGRKQRKVCTLSFTVFKNCCNSKL
jgi:hypothetical protein